MRTWPKLTVAEWEPTRDTLHMWTQIVGKIRMALEPAVNHWWQVPLYVSARGLTTSLMHAETRSLEIEFDFVHQALVFRPHDGPERTLALEPRTTADFYDAVFETLRELDVDVAILGRPVEIPVAIPFADDTTHASYDPDAAHRFWLQLVEIERVLRVFRSRFIGKHSPVHFFWGAFDLATTRFSGRPAPEHGGGVPNCADWVMQEAYSHEVSSCGFWPGGSDEGSFYAYAYPEPDGYRSWSTLPGEAYYDEALGEFILPYAAVRAAADPDALVLEFLQTTYDAAATLADWDRPSLEAHDD
jgi:hypothetical protein